MSKRARWELLIMGAAIGVTGTLGVLAVLVALMARLQGY